MHIRLGHKSRITLDIYSHVIPGLQETAVDQFANELFERKALVISFPFTANTPTK